jgi:predicted transcriptional regulator
MAVTRHAVLDAVAAASDADTGETTSPGAIATTLGVPERVVSGHIQGLAACDLVRTYGDGRLRITVTGEELLALDTDEVVIVDAE